MKRNKKEKFYDAEEKNIINYNVCVVIERWRTKKLI
jgi:hypothetical protein